MKPPPGFEKRELGQPAVTPDASPSASVDPKIAATAQKSSDDAKVSRRPLPPKRQLWIVRVPKPPSEELHPEASSNEGAVSVDEQITTRLLLELQTQESKRVFRTQVFRTLHFPD